MNESRQRPHTRKKPLNRWTHTHTQREREREREQYSTVIGGYRVGILMNATSHNHRQQWDSSSWSGVRQYSTLLSTCIAKTLQNTHFNDKTTFYLKFVCLSITPAPLESTETAAKGSQCMTIISERTPWCGINPTTAAINPISPIDSTTTEINQRLAPRVHVA